MAEDRNEPVNDNLRVPENTEASGTWTEDSLRAYLNEKVKKVQEELAEWRSPEAGWEDLFLHLKSTWGDTWQSQWPDSELVEITTSAGAGQQVRVSGYLLPESVEKICESWRERQSTTADEVRRTRREARDLLDLFNSPPRVDRNR